MKIRVKPPHLVQHIHKPYSKVRAVLTRKVSLVVMAAVITPVLVVGGLVIGYQVAFFNRIYPGVKVGVVPVGTLTYNDAVARINGMYKMAVSKPLTLASNDRTWQIQAEALSVTVDAPTSARRALIVGKSADFKQNMLTQRRLLTHGVVIEPLFIYNKAKLDARLAEITQAIEVEPQSSKIAFVDGQFVAAPSIDGKKVDRALLAERLARHFSSLSNQPVEIPLVVAQPALTADQAAKLIPALTRYEQEPLQLVFEDKKTTLDVNTILQLINYEQSTDTASSSAGFSLSQAKVASYIATFAEGIDRPPKDALFNFQDGKVTAFQPSQDGIEVDRKALAAKLEETLLEGGESRVITVPVRRTQAKIATEGVNDFGIKERIGHGESNFRNSPADRIFNVSLAVSRINGTLIPPGEEFSFNNAAGEISQDTGYKQALVILSGRTVLGDGGGVCQVSTTVFRAALDAGVPITARTAHAFRVSYYENDRGPGFDATIYQPGVDFKFKNDTGHYILLQARVDLAATKIYIDLYGTSDGRQSVVSKATVHSTSPAPPDVYQDDPNLPKGTTKQVEHSVPGAKVSFTRTVTRNGETLIQESFNSNFRPWAAVFLVGTKEGT